MFRLHHHGSLNILFVGFFRKQHLGGLQLPAGLPLHQTARELYLHGGSWLVFQDIEYNVGAKVTHVVSWRMDGSQRRRSKSRQAGVVKAHQGNIIWHPNAFCS